MNVTWLKIPEDTFSGNMSQIRSVAVIIAKLCNLKCSFDLTSFLWATENENKIHHIVSNEVPDCNTLSLKLISTKALGETTALFGASLILI